jgi:hypothetical protein
MNITTIETMELNKKVEEIFQELDQDEDGYLSKDEFMNMKNKNIIKTLMLYKIKDNIKEKVENGAKVTFGSKSWNNALKMMMGIRILKDFVPEKMKRKINKEDFTYVSSFELPDFGNNEKSIFISKCPHVYLKIREICNISNNEFYVNKLIKKVFNWTRTSKIIF